VPLGKRDRTERLQFYLHANELAAIDDFRFKARMPSRSAALRELLRRGMAAPALAGKKGRQNLKSGNWIHTNDERV
jgi:hypothetical protein